MKSGKVLIVTVSNEFSFFDCAIKTGVSIFDLECENLKNVLFKNSRQSMKTIFMEKSKNDFWKNIKMIHGNV